jgi:ribosome-associated protein
MDTLELAKRCALFADDKKADNIKLLDVRSISPITDFILVCSANSSPHLRAIRDEIVFQVREQHQIKPLVSDGTHDSQWLIINFPNIYVHIFSPEKREFYAIERLWKDAPTLNLESYLRPAKPEAAKVAKKAIQKTAAKKTAKTAVKTAVKTAKTSAKTVKTAAKKAVKTAVKKTIAAVTTSKKIASKKIAAKKVAAPKTAKKTIVKKAATKSAAKKVSTSKTKKK